MKKSKKTWDHLSKEERNSSIEKIRTFFIKERDEKLGLFAAEDLLDFFLENIGPIIYNQGVEASKEQLRNSFDDMQLDLDLLLNK